MPRRRQLHTVRSAHHAVPLTLRGLRFLFGRVGGLLPGLFGAWAYRLWFRTRRFPESGAARRAKGEATRDTVAVSVIPIAVYRWGRGPRVLFVHGWSGRGTQVAAFLPGLLQAGYEVIAPDAPGHGETPGDKTNILEITRALRVLDDVYGPFHAAITHSFGGMALAFAMRQGMRVQRVVMISAPADLDFLLNRFTHTLGLHPSVQKNLMQRLDRRFEQGYRERLSTVSNVRHLAVPALVIHDRDDSGVPAEQGERVAAAWPGARFLLTEGLGHGRILRDASVLTAVIDFVCEAGV